jgi:DNA invertase Pin-like site-specific DNA recombinase
VATAVYIRVSTDDQELGRAAQEQACIRYAELRKLGDVQVYCDVGVSGSTPLDKRPQGGQLVGDIDDGEVDAVVAVRLDRLFRDTADTLTTVKWWDTLDVALHLLDMGGSAVDTSSPIGRLLITVLAGMAEFERQLIAERTAAAKRAQRARGEYLGGTVPFGFELDDRQLVPHEEERNIAAVALHERSQGKTWDQVAKLLNRRELLNRGRPWRKDTLCRRIGRYQTRQQEAQTA